MPKAIIPAWYFPITVVFIDDNTSFLKKMLLTLSGKNIPIKLINDPSKAIQFLQKQSAQGSIVEELMEAEIENQQGGIGNIDDILNAFGKRIFDPNRFSEAGIGVIDYAMPGLNGLEVCSELRAQDSPLNILMLTGEGSTQLAVGAFNEEQIDKFMRKDEPDFQEKLLHAIRIMQNSYFQKISKFILNRLDVDQDNRIAPNLYDQKFIELFHNICQENDIVEYYLVNSDGSFLLVNAKGNPFLLAVRNEQSMLDAYDVALNASEPFPPQILDAMEKNEKILCLYGMDICEDPAQAEKFLQPAKKLVGETNYYYALVKDLTNYDIDLSKITGIKSYLDKATSANDFFVDKI